MKNILRAACLGLIGLTLVLPFNAVQAQQVKCDPLPRVEWWSQSHAKVTATVEKRYKGSWDKYIERWNNYLKRMNKTIEAKSVAVVKSRGLKMKGKVLEDHIKQINERIAVLKCLRDNQSKAIAKPNAQLSPGGEKVAEVTEATLNLEVTAQCENGGVTFKVTNLGEKWLKLASINIFHVSSRTLISKRRMKLKNSQQVTFKVLRKKMKTGKTVGIFIEPTWIKRTFKFDALQNCQ